MAGVLDALLALCLLGVCCAHQPSSYDAGVTACGKGFDQFPFCDTTLSIDERVTDLVGASKLL